MNLKALAILLVSLVLSLAPAVTVAQQPDTPSVFELLPELKPPPSYTPKTIDCHGTIKIGAGKLIACRGVLWAPADSIYALWARDTLIPALKIELHHLQRESVAVLQVKDAIIAANAKRADQTDKLVTKVVSGLKPQPLSILDSHLFWFGTGIAVGAVTATAAIGIYSALQ